MNAVSRLGVLDLNRVKRFLLLALLLQLGACTSVFFQPSKSMLKTPVDYGIRHEVVTLMADDGIQLNAWYLFSPPGKAKGRLLYLHGNGKNISYHLRPVAWLPQQGWEVLMLDYRGYGASEGKAKLPEVIQDLSAAYDFLAEMSRKDELPIFVLGQSLGGALTTYFVANETLDPMPKGIVLDAPFNRYDSAAAAFFSRHWYIWWMQPLAFVFPNQFDPLLAAQKMPSLPLLFFHSTDDRIIPYELGQDLFEQLPSPKRFVTTYGKHIYTFEDRVNRSTLVEFLNENGQRAIDCKSQTYC